MAKVAFQLVMPERLLASGEADMVVVPGGEGDFGVQPGKSPLISTVRPGVVRVYQDGKVSESYLVAGGFAEATPTSCTVLAEEAQALGEVSAENMAQRVRDAEAAVASAEGAAGKAVAEKALKVAQDLQRAHAFYAGH
jgi:F-type H+-transporting ATPase subunit epsilon